MPGRPPEDDDVLSLIEETRAWLAAQSARERVERQPERRVEEQKSRGVRGLAVSMAAIAPIIGQLQINDGGPLEP